MKFTFSVVFILMALSSTALAGWFTSDGDTVEECLENRRSDIHNESQLNVALAYCGSKHPYKAPPTPAYEPLTYHSVIAVGANNSRLWTLTNNISIMSWGVSEYINSPLTTRATNRNDFSIDGVIIGTIPNAKNSTCPNEHKAYHEVVTCYGKAFPKQSGTFSCLDLHPAKNKKDNHLLCLIGFVVKTTESDFKSFLK